MLFCELVVATWYFLKMEIEKVFNQVWFNEWTWTEVWTEFQAKKFTPTENINLVHVQVHKKVQVSECSGIILLSNRANSFVVKDDIFQGGKPIKMTHQ